MRPNTNSVQTSSSSNINSVSTPLNSSQNLVTNLTGTNTNNVNKLPSNLNDVDLANSNINDVQTGKKNANYVLEDDFYKKYQMPITQEGFLGETKDALQYLAMSKNQPQLQKSLFQYDMINPQQTPDNTQNERDLARSQRAFQKNLRNTDATSMIQGGLGITSDINEQRSKMNENVQGINRQENLRVNNEMNNQKQKRTIYDNKQIGIDNQNKIAQAQVDNQNMLNFSNLTYKGLMQNGQNEVDMLHNKEGMNNQMELMKADAEAKFSSENQDIIKQNKIVADELEMAKQALMNSSPAERLQAETNYKTALRAKEEIQNKYDEKYKLYEGTLADQMDRLRTEQIRGLGYGKLYKNSNKFSNPYATPPISNKQGGILKYQKGKALKKGVYEFLTDKGIQIAGNAFNSQKSERKLDWGDAITTGMSFVPGLSVAGSLIDNARDAYDEYKAGDLDYKDFIRYGADTATNIIPGMKAIKNAKKVGKALNLSEKLKMFKSGGMNLSEKKELELYKKQLKDIAENSKELTKLQRESIKDYITEKRKSSRINNERIWNIVSKIIK